MEKLSTNTVRAIAFCLSTNSIRTRIHFFPSAGITTGPYSIQCNLSLFVKGSERKTVMLDGGRLGQPDGVRLEDAFPHIRTEQSGIFGLEIRLSCHQARVNLLSSQCAIELVGPQYNVMYGVSPFTPVAVEQETPGFEGGSDIVIPARKRPWSSLGLQDAVVSSSLVLVNGTNEAIKPDVYRLEGERTVTLQVGTVSPESALEVPLEESLFRESTPNECAWGLVRAEGVYVGSNSIAPGVGYYVMYRDIVSKKPLSVCAL